MTVAGNHHRRWSLTEARKLAIVHTLGNQLKRPTGTVCSGARAIASLINMRGCYSCSMPEAVARGELRPLAGTNEA